MLCYCLPTSKPGFKLSSPSLSNLKLWHKFIGSNGCCSNSTPLFWFRHNAKQKPLVPPTPILLCWLHWIWAMQGDVLFCNSVSSSYTALFLGCFVWTFSTSWLVMKCGSLGSWFVVCVWIWAWLNSRLCISSTIGFHNLTLALMNQFETCNKKCSFHCCISQFIPARKMDAFV